MTLTAQTLRSLLDYEPDTGVFHWRVNRTAGVKAGDVAGRGKLNENGYQRVRVLGRLYVAHRLAWLHMTGAWPQFEVDHINGNRADNRCANLRDVGDAVNAQNTHGTRRDNEVGRAGVGKRKTGRYYARIRHNGKLIVLGRFDDADTAHEAYIAAKREMHAGFVGSECALSAG